MTYHSNQREVLAQFERLGGINTNGYPFFPGVVNQTEMGTPYLTSPGVHLISKPATNLESVGHFLANFDGQLGFDNYLVDPTQLPDGASLCKFAGQLCYMAFGPGRTKNAEAEKYFENIKSSGHGSVLEHANFSFLIYGDSRSFTHELVRHRAGCGFSQVSQRYVSGKTLRFVERIEFQDGDDFHTLFIESADEAVRKYDQLTEKLLAKQEDGYSILSGEKKTDLRKKVQQTSRARLPNETEAPIVMTANARAWRHVLEMRASSHAETEIRRVGHFIHLCLALADPILFGDYSIAKYEDGTFGVDTPHRKV